MRPSLVFKLNIYSGLFDSANIVNNSIWYIASVISQL